MDSMQRKKNDYDSLKATHVHELWQNDLDSLMEALDKQEQIDEKDRLAHEGMSHKGSKKTGRTAAKKPQMIKSVGAQK